MKVNNKAIVIGIGKDCPKCGKPMNRKRHPDSWKPSHDYYYEKWNHCLACQHVQHYEEFKNSSWKEKDYQESFFRSLQ